MRIFDCGEGDECSVLMLRGGGTREYTGGHRLWSFSVAKGDLSGVRGLTGDAVRRNGVRCVARLLFFYCVEELGWGWRGASMHVCVVSGVWGGIFMLRDRVVAQAGSA